MPQTRAPLTADDIALVKDYASEVQKTFGSAFNNASDRFSDGCLLLDRFHGAVESVLSNGRGYFRAVDEAHNELCVVGALPSASRPAFSNFGDAGAEY